MISGSDSSASIRQAVTCRLSNGLTNQRLLLCLVVFIPVFIWTCVTAVYNKEHINRFGLFSVRFDFNLPTA